MNANKLTTSECSYFNVKEYNWYNLPNMNNKRKNASICFYNNISLFAFRGEDDNGLLDTIEYININENKEWKLIKPIDYGFVWYPAKNSLAVTVDKNKIIICGGEDNNNNLFKDCFLYDPSNCCVYKGLDMTIASSFCSEGGYHKDIIYGIDNKNNMINNKKLIHTFLINTGKWKNNSID